MHLSDGILHKEILIGGYIVASPFVYVAFKRLQNEELPKAAAFSALFFIASFIHIPVGFTSVHLILNGFIGAFLGVAAFPVILVGLFIQALLFGYGGITTLGVNLLVMALPALWARFLYLRIHTKNSKLPYFLLGFSTTLLTIALFSAVLFANGEGFRLFSSLFFLSQLPLLLIEGLVSSFAIIAFKKIIDKELQ